MPVVFRRAWPRGVWTRCSTPDHRALRRPTHGVRPLEGSKNSMPEARGSVGGTRIRRSSRWDERIEGEFEEIVMEAGCSSSKLWTVADDHRVERAGRGLVADPQAARSYSWMTPPRVTRRQTSPVRVCSWRGSGGASWGPRCGRDSLLWRT